MRRCFQLGLLLTLLGWCVPAQAAAPTFAACTLSTRDSNNTTDTVNLPASIAAGDLILIFHFKDEASTNTSASGWTEIKDVNDAAATIHLWVGYLIAAGGETTATVVSSNSERFASIACRIAAAAWHGTTPPEISASATGNSQDGPNPDAVTASWGAEENMFIAIACVDITAVVDGYPANYADNQTASNATVSSARGGIATRALTAASDDPGIFSLDASEQWIAATMVVRPAGGAPPPATAPPTQMMMGVGD